jgi:DNA-binding transcriptional LysR family regulator
LKSFVCLRGIDVIDLKGVDLNLLVSLSVLLDEGNVTRAAERLHVGQPALSAQLARLRRLFDDPLLVPSPGGRGMTATPRAQALEAPLHEVLRGLEQLVRQRPEFDPHRDERMFQVAETDNALVIVGLPLIESLAREAGPGVRLALRAPDAPEAIAQLERGDVDLLIGIGDRVPPTMRSRRLLTERFVLVQRHGHPRGTGALDLDAYCALTHVVVSSTGGSHSGLLDAHLAGLGRRREVMLSVQHFTLLPEIVRTTDHVATLPSRLAERHAATLERFELPFASPLFTLHAAWHPRQHADPALRWLRTMLVAAVGGGDQD